MKVLSITVEKNFHCMNDDRFIMEKISVTSEVEEGESVHSVINIVREEIVTNFKKAYPNLRT